MTKFTVILTLHLYCFLGGILSANAQENGQINIIVIGAHPDDCDILAGGTAALWAKMGHKVKFLSVTSGDAGHHEKGGGELAKIRREEAKEAGKRLGIAEYETLDNHDGELLPSLDVRLQLIRKIREWEADVVIGHRPNDYHPDHRYTGILVQDAAYMVAVPNIAPDTPPLQKNPVFLYPRDRFQRPNPHRPDIVVAIDEVFEQKIQALDAHVSQMYEWLPWIGGYADEVPEGKEARIKWLASKRKTNLSPEMLASLEKWYGKDKASKVVHAESFEICEYGSQPSDEQVRVLFPMLK